MSIVHDEYPPFAWSARNLALSSLHSAPASEVAKSRTSHGTSGLILSAVNVESAKVMSACSLRREVVWIQVEKVAGTSQEVSNHMDLG
jgi:hypothetical protein